MMCNLFATWCTALLSNVFCIQSMNQTINYTFIAKTFLLQAVLKYFIWEICFALYMICIIVLMTEALILHTVLKDFIWERHVALYVLCVGFFWLIFYWHIREFWVKAGIFLFRLSSVAHVFETLNPCSIFLCTLYIILSPNVVLTPLHLSPLT